MNIIYNTQKEIASKISDFILKVFPDIRKTQLKIIPYILIGMILSESVVASDISNKLKDEFSLVQNDSVIKRIRRFFKNKFFDPYTFYDKIISFIISNYKKKHNDSRIHIIFDHMFSKDNYTVFMITMRLGKQGIPLWFRCFNDNDSSAAFKEDLLKQGISYVSNLFDNKFDLIFLADRWFNSTSLLDHINSLGHTYCVRLKKNIKCFIYDKNEGHDIWKWLYDLKSYEYHSNLFYDLPITDNKYIVNLAIGKRHDVNESWIIVTNGNPKRAIKDYGYRFGGIEAVFKNQKSNGFYLENTVNASLKYFESMYSIACFGILFLTMAGADFSKNGDIYKNVKIETHKIIKGKKTRVMSLFNTGLKLFNLGYNSSKYIRIPLIFVLYDV